MRTPALLATALLLALAPQGQAASRCAHLVSDPAGDVAFLPNGPLPGPADDGRQVDLTWVELASTRTTLTATLHVANLNPESQPAVDHDYTVDFVNGGQVFELDGAFNRTGDFAWLAHGTAAQDVDGQARASAYEVIADATATRDTHRSTITISVPLSAFAGVHRLSGTLASINAATYSGAATPVEAGYASDDYADTAKGYRLGSAACLR